MESLSLGQVSRRVAEGLVEGGEQFPWCLEQRKFAQRRATGWRDQDSARAATQADAHTLGIDTGSAVAIGRNWYYDQDGTAIEYGQRVSVPGRWSTHEGTIN